MGHLLPHNVYKQVSTKAHHKSLTASSEENELLIALIKSALPENICTSLGTKISRTSYQKGAITWYSEPRYLITSNAGRLDLWLLYKFLHKFNITRINFSCVNHGTNNKSVLVTIYKQGYFATSFFQIHLYATLSIDQHTRVRKNRTNR